MYPNCSILSRKIILTEDGSQSLYDEELNETYHSTKGARSESEYVFIEQGLDHWLETCEKQEVTVLEVGMGTGLNAWLAWQWAEKQTLSVRYITLEPYPLDHELVKQLILYDDAPFQLVHAADWDEWQLLSDHFKLIKHQTGIENYAADTRADVIFFDAFAPSRQPDIWSMKNLKKCHELLHAGGILTTYCAQGQFKRDLSAVGFSVEILPGALGKKEMVRGRKK